ncbi:hypothetical protein V8G54_027854 [Vigna mungo]|uniref:Uncharacterized protein n=1 Tax=Vigna mungo TaxID=3915 RepID=A0AAQ3RHM8_VIGMU
MSGQDPSRPDKGKTAKYIIRVPSTIPFASVSTPPDVGSSRPPPSSTAAHTSYCSAHSFSCRATPDPSMAPPPYIHPSPSIPTPSSIPSPDVHQPSVDPTDPTDMGDPAPHD